MESSLLHQFQKDSRFKVIKSQIPFLPAKTFLADISLKDRNNEEKHYKKDPNLCTLLRRGTSFILLKNEVLWARKGQKKFFELKPGHYPSLSPENYSKIWKTSKANGENAQISYNSRISCWIIGSKNVSIAARSEEDLSLYTSLRFNYAKLIASSWFSLISTLPDPFGLQSALDGFTLIGEYVGNPDCQHIIKYEKISIQFFSIVSHQDLQSFSCRTDFALDFFQKFRLPHVQCEEIQINHENFNESLEEFAKGIQEISIQDGQEGFVLYFSDEIGTCWMNKVKTFEYKFLRKLREKIRKDKNKGFEDFCFYLKQQEKKTGKNLEKFLEKAKNVAFDETNSKIEIQNNFANVLNEENERKVFISLGIPGIGKSFLVNHLKQLYPSLSVVSSDEIRDEEMSKLKKTNPGLSEDALFNRTKKSSQAAFTSKLNSSSFPLYLDKNFPPMGFSCKSLGLVEPFSVTAFYQKSSLFRINNKFWPFSLEVLYTCIQRAMNRKNHFTLKDPLKSAEVCILFYNLFQNHQISNYLKNGVAKIVPVSFVNEELVSVPDEFREIITEILNELKPGKSPPVEKVKKLVSTVNLEQVVFGDIKIGEEIPIFLGIKVEVNPSQLVSAGLKLLKKKFDENEEINADLKDISKKSLKTGKSIWKFEESLYINVLFIGQNSKVLHSNHYKEFEEGKEYKFRVSHIVYCPKKLVIAVVKFLNEAPLISNKVPHLTLFSNKVPKKINNEVLENIEFFDEIRSQSCVLGECFCIPFESEEYSGTSKKFFS
jgi:hypothetical protein